jgi:hypothetical protein
VVNRQFVVPEPDGYLLRIYTDAPSDSQQASVVRARPAPGDPGRDHVRMSDVVFGCGGMPLARPGSRALPASCVISEPKPVLQ